MRRPALPLVLSAFALGAVLASAFAGDNSFPRHTFKSFQRQLDHPLPAASDRAYDAARPGLEVVAEFTGAVRRMPDARRAFLADVGRMQQATPLADLYHEEVEVREQGRSYWIPMQDKLLPPFRDEVKKGALVTLQLRYLGAAAEFGRFYVAVEFDASAVAAIPRETCFASEMAGVRVGDEWKATLARLQQRSGEPFLETESRGQRVQGFVLDPEHETQLIVMDGGVNYPDRVFTVQVTGPPNRALALHGGLWLGAAPDAVRKVLGEPSATRPSGEGYTRMEYAGSSCSVELREGVLASLLITADSHYFQD